jgi:hypothetical protein
MYALESRWIPATRYFFRYSEARAYAQLLGIGPRSYRIRPVH